MNSEFENVTSGYLEAYSNYPKNLAHPDSTKTQVCFERGRYGETGDPLHKSNGSPKSGFHQFCPDDLSASLLQRHDVTDWRQTEHNVMG